MKTGTVLLILMIVFVALGYLLSDNIHLRHDLEVNKIQQMQAQQKQLEQQLAESQVNFQQLSSQLSESEIGRLKAENQVLELQAELQKREQSVQKKAFEGRVELSGYVEYSGVVLAKATLTYPQEMNLGDSQPVILTLIPNKIIESSLVNQTPDAKIAIPTIQLSNDVQINHVMKAGLSGVGFDIVDSINEQEIKLDTPSEWVWTIKAKEEGSHILVINIAIPSTVQGIEESVNANVRLYPIEVRVNKPINKQFIDLLPYIIPAASGLIGIVIGAFLNFGKQPKAFVGKRDNNLTLIASKKKRASKFGKVKKHNNR